MAYPEKKALLHWASNYPALWNAGDKQAWVDNWRSVANGEFTMFDPVGTPEKRGFKACCEDSWDLFQSRVRFTIQPGTLFVCGSEVPAHDNKHLGDIFRVYLPQNETGL